MRIGARFARSRVGEARGAEATSMSDDDRELLCAETARLVMGWTAADIPWAYDGATPVWHTSAGEPVT